MTNPNGGTQNDTDPAIACDLLALDPDQRARRVQLAEAIRANVTRVVEISNGYELHLRPNDGVVRQAEELVALERKCCRFLTLGLRRDGTTGDWVLEVSGEGGAKAFIAVEMGVLGAQGNVAG